MALNPALKGIIGLIGPASGVRYVPSESQVTLSGSALYITVVAQEFIPNFSVATYTGQLANSGSLSSLGRVAGISLGSISVSFSGPVFISGDITNLGWSWPAGASIFLNGTSLSTVPPATGFIQKIGVAKNSQVITINLGEPILL